MTTVTKKTESGEQAALIEWANLNAQKHPQLSMIFAIPNGGLRSKATAGRLKREGVKAGVPDLFLPVRSHHGTGSIRTPLHCGLFIEMKVRGNVATPAQCGWHLRLDGHGYKVVIAYSFEEARDAILAYLGIEAIE